MSRQQITGTAFSALVCALLLCVSIVSAHEHRAARSASHLDHTLEAVLRQAGFTGRIEASLEQRLGRRIDQQLAEVGRLLWFDTHHRPQ